jgi:dCMP deaminase
MDPILQDTKQARQALKNSTYMKMAITIANLGTCQRGQVGCILLSKEGRVVGAGYNGAGPGMAHCTPETCNPSKRCLRCSHAEENAVANASGTPYIAYVTHEPCGACTRKLLQAGIRKIFFSKAYNSMPPEEREARQEWLDHYGVEVYAL